MIDRPADPSDPYRLPPPRPALSLPTLPPALSPTPARVHYPESITPRVHRRPTIVIRAPRLGLVFGAFIPAGIFLLIHAQLVRPDPEWIGASAFGVGFAWMGAGAVCAVLGNHVVIEQDKMTFRFFSWYRFREFTIGRGAGATMRHASYRHRFTKVDNLTFWWPNERRKRTVPLSLFGRRDRLTIVRRSKELAAPR